MPVTAAPGERYTIRRKVFKLFGAGFHIYDPAGNLVGYCKQKAFKLKEDLRIFTDENLSQELFRIAARSVIDFSATYDVTLPTGESLGSLRRKGLGSFFRDSWLVFDASGREVATLKEDSALLAILRRLHDVAAALMPQKLHLVRADGTRVASYRAHFNPFIYRLGVSVDTPDPDLDDLMILATGCLIASVEGRQS